MLKEPVALVTGVTGTLGRATAVALQGAGFRVAGMSRSGSAPPNVALEQADVTRWDDVHAAIDRLLQRFGRIDALVNVAGGFAGGKTVADTDEHEWDLMMDLNLKSVFVLCKAVIPAMLSAGFGRIINVSSRTAVEPSALYAVYGVSKMGVLTLTQTLALELKNHNVTVNAVLPSIVDTPANRQSMPNADFAKWVRPEAIAAVIVDVVSDRWGVVSGAAIPVFGRA
ncbi:MAG: SDR family oxidoreductase [Chloroflexota bacterium]|nr:SDR family oxidoreductase [Chloroflexota bacterium]